MWGGFSWGWAAVVWQPVNKSDQTTKTQPPCRFLCIAKRGVQSHRLYYNYTVNDDWLVRGSINLVPWNYFLGLPCTIVSPFRLHFRHWSSHPLLRHRQFYHRTTAMASVSSAPSQVWDSTQQSTAVDIAAFFKRFQRGKYLYTSQNSPSVEYDRLCSELQWGKRRADLHRAELIQIISTKGDENIALLVLELLTNKFNAAGVQIPQTDAVGISKAIAVEVLKLAITVGNDER